MKAFTIHDFLKSLDSLTHLYKECAFNSESL